METEVNRQIFLHLVLLHMARDNLCNGSLLINKTSPHGLLQIPLSMQLSTTINGSVMFLTCQLPKWLIKLQLPLLSLLVQITVIMVQPISISELLDIFQYQLLKLSGQPEVLLTLRTLLKLLLMLLLKQLGTLMLPFSKKMQRWTLLPQLSHHQKHQLYHHFQTCHGLQHLTLDMLNNQDLKML